MVLKFLWFFSLQVLEVPSGKILATLLGHTRTVLHCQFSQNGQTLITSSEDTTIRVGLTPFLLQLIPSCLYCFLFFVFLVFLFVLLSFIDLSLNLTV